MKNSWFKKPKENNYLEVFEACLCGIVFGLATMIAINNYTKELDAITETTSITGEITDLQHYYDGGFPADGIPGAGDVYYAYVFSDGKEFKVTLDKESYSALKIGDTITADYSYYIDENGEKVYRKCIGY